MNKYSLAGLIVIAIIAIGGYGYPHSQIVQQTLGAAPGADFLFPQINFNGVKREETRKGLVLATTTPCAIKSPGATSTLAYASVMVTTASSTATTWVFAKASTPFATTTRLNQFSLSSGVQGTMVSTSTPSTANSIVDETSTFGPNTYFVVSKAGDAPAGTGLGGFCSAEFTLI